MLLQHRLCSAVVYVTTAHSRQRPIDAAMPPPRCLALHAAAVCHDDAMLMPLLPRRYAL